MSLKRAKKGDVSVLTMVLLLFTMSMVGVSTNVLTVKNLRSALASKDSINAFYFAEKGIEYRVELLKQDANKAYVISCAEKHASFFEVGGPGSEYNPVNHFSDYNGELCHGIEYRTNQNGNQVVEYTWSIESQIDALAVPPSADDDVNILRINGYSESGRTARAIRAEIEFPFTCYPSKDVIFLVDGTTSPEYKNANPVGGGAAINMRSALSIFLYKILEGYVGRDLNFKQGFKFMEDRLALVRQIGWYVPEWTDFKGIERDESWRSGVPQTVVNCSGGTVGSCTQDLKYTYKGWLGQCDPGCSADPSNCDPTDPRSLYCTPADSDPDLYDYMNGDRANCTTINSELGPFDRCKDEDGTTVPNDVVRFVSSMIQVNKLRDDNGDSIPDELDIYNNPVKTVVVKIDGGEYHQMPVLHEPDQLNFFYDREDASHILKTYQIGDQNTDTALGVADAVRSNLHTTELDRWKNDLGADEVLWVRFNLNYDNSGNSRGENIGNKDWFPSTHNYMVENEYCLDDTSYEFSCDQSLNPGENGGPCTCPYFRKFGEITKSSSGDTSGDKSSFFEYDPTQPSSNNGSGSYNDLSQLAEDFLRALRSSVQTDCPTDVTN